jgi:hypothetical protein
MKTALIIRKVLKRIKEEKIEKRELKKMTQANLRQPAPCDFTSRHVILGPTGKRCDVSPIERPMCFDYWRLIPRHRTSKIAIKTNSVATDIIIPTAN